MINFLRTIAFLSTFMLGISSASAQNHVEINLRSSVDTAVAGQSFDIILEKKMDPHWHTYWKNPGESGFPIQANWDLPEGVSVDEFQWPIPHALDVQGIMNFVHEDIAYLITRVKLPEEIDTKTVTIGLQADWLVCKEICIPETGSVSLVLPVGDEVSKINEDLFETAYASLPTKYEVSIDPRLAVDETSDEVIITVNKNAFTDQLNEKEPVVFFSHDWGLVKAGSPAKISTEGETVQFVFPRADRALAEIKTFEGVLAQGKKGVAIDVKSLQVLEGATDGTTLEEENVETETGSATVGLLTAILFAVLGGLILNLMPCVFPILSMKALSLVKIAAKNRKESLLHGLSYTVGILVSFLGLAGAIIALKAGGAEIGWGFQLQNPFVVMLIVWLLFIIGLNLFGAFDVTGRFTQIGSNKLANAQGYTQDFFTGVLAVIVATPCTAPFMGVALGYALVQPAYVTILVFLGLGLGLALPFLLLSIMPALQKIMPKPGAWMETFKQFLAFPMWATAIWLSWVLVQQSGAQGLVSVLSGILIISFVLWLVKHKPTGLLHTLKMLLLVLSVIGLWKSATMLSNLKTEQVAYSPTVLENALKTDNPVFVNMTAAWCITCKVNEISIKSDEVQKLFEEKGMTYIVGDWTLMDSEITKYLESFDRTGVPLYVYYPSGDRKNPVILPQILTPQIIEDIIN